MNGVVIALAGGVLIGLSAVLLMLALGRIAGVAGIVGGLFAGGSGEAGWRLAFVTGLIAGPFAAMLFGAPLPEIAIDAPASVVLVAGLLVGFGSRLGNGCTSGHGLCGLARLSPRSLVATLTFMTVGAAVVFVARHVLGG
jgi:uncharacterized membrane protein YedE/YeeE